MRVIFLDIDGVLNSLPHFATLPKDRTNISWVERAELMLDPACVERLNELTASINANVVISSSWRHGHTIDRLKEMLAKRGFKGNVIGVTPSLLKARGLEIQAWLDEHPEVDSFVILDDDHDMEHLMSRLVKTSMDTGITDEHVDAAIKLFI